MIYWFIVELTLGGGTRKSTHPVGDHGEMGNVLKEALRARLKAPETKD